MTEDELLNELIDAAVLDHDRARELLRRHPQLLHAKKSLGETSLHFLAVENYPVGVDFLAKAGADVNTRNEFDKTPLMEAKLLGYEEMVKLLLSHGANPEDLKVEYF